MPIRAKCLCSIFLWIQVTLVVWFFFFFREARSERLPEILVSSIYVFVFLSGLWEWMTNDTEGSTSRSLKLRERYDLSPWLTCAISLRTYSNSWLNPSLFRCHFFISVPLHSPCFWSIFRDKDLLFIQREPFRWNPSCVGKERIWISHDNVFHWKQREAWAGERGCAQKYTNMHTVFTVRLWAGTPPVHQPHTNIELAQTKELQFSKKWILIALTLGRKTSSAASTGREQVRFSCSFPREVDQHL